MILISHRGNTSGSRKERENTKSYIQEALDMGYHVEVDIWKKGGELFLGHDGPENEVDKEWLLDRKEKLWVHAKNPEALFSLTYEHLSPKDSLAVFFHEKEKYALIYNGRNQHGIVINGLIWAHDMQKLNSKCIVPLLNQSDIAFRKIPKQHLWGICSDYVSELQTRF